MSKLNWGVAAAALMSISNTSFADVAPSTAVQDTIIVKGQYLYSDKVNSLKAPTAIIDVPQSLSITTADQIAERGYTSIGDIVNYTPGVNTSQGEGHRDAVVFRGVRSTADFYLDGVRDDVQYYRPLYNLEQVEILRGPNALLFGRGGTGGILNRVTKKGQIGEEFAGYQVSADTFGGYELNLDTNVTLSDTSTFRLNAMYGSLENHRDFFGGQQIGLNPTFKFALSPKTSLDLSYEYANHERFIDRGIPTGSDGEPIERFKDIVFGDPDLNETEFVAHLFRAKLQHEFSENLKGNFSAFYGDYDKLYQNFYAANYTASDADFGGAETVDLDGYVDTTQRTNFILSGNLVGEFTTGMFGHTVVAGAEYIDTSNDNDRYNPVFSTFSDSIGMDSDREAFLITAPLNFRGGAGIRADGITPTSMSFTDLNDKSYGAVDVFSAYVQDQIEINQYLDVVLGARFDSFEIGVDAVDKGVFNSTGIEETSNTTRRDEEISPRFGLIFKPQENISVYTSYSESFIPSSGGQFASLGGTNEALAPDKFENLEAGLKWDFAEALSFTAAVFQIQSTSPEVDSSTVTNPTGDVSIQVRVEAETTGFEAQLLGQITEQWNISAGYSYLDGEIINQGGDTGLRPRELPEHTFSVWNSYQATEKLGFGLGVSYQDESFINNDNSSTLAAYTRVDAAAFYDVSEKLRIQLNVENLTDETYFPNAHSTHQVTVGEPLNARLTVRGRF